MTFTENQCQIAASMPLGKVMVTPKKEKA